MSVLTDAKFLQRGKRMIGFLGPFSSSFTLAWMASHRGRLRTFVLGGKHLTLLFIFDTDGREKLVRSDAEVEAVRTIVYGSKLGDEPTKVEVQQ